MAIRSLHQFSRFYLYVRLLGFHSDSFPHSNLSFSAPLQSLSNLEASLLNREASMRLWWRWCFIHDEYDEQVTVFSLCFSFWMYVCSCTQNEEDGIWENFRLPYPFFCPILVSLKRSHNMWEFCLKWKYFPHLWDLFILTQKPIWKIARDCLETRKLKRI